MTPYTSTLKGLDLAQAFFEQEAVPRFRQSAPEIFELMAAGLVGDGSDCFGYDDEISRDHDWGPGFCIWLTTSDYANFGVHAKALYNSLPKIFNSFGPRRMSIENEHRIGVSTIDEFYYGFIGCHDTPENLTDWLLIPENSLAACTNGRVFHDPLGEFSLRRERLKNFYPEDVRRKKIAARCMTTGQAGQYNFPRCLKRNEKVALQYAQTKFLADLISTVFLLNRRYTPFYKWMHRALKELPLEGEWFYTQIEHYTNTNDDESKVEMIETLCTKAIHMLQEQGLSSSKSTFLPDHGPEILNGIQDPSLRKRNVWVG